MITPGAVSNAEIKMVVSLINFSTNFTNKPYPYSGFRRRAKTEGKFAPFYASFALLAGRIEHFAKRIAQPASSIAQTAETLDKTEETKAQNDEAKTFRQTTASVW